MLHVLGRSRLRQPLLDQGQRHPRRLLRPFGRPVDDVGHRRPPGPGQRRQGDPSRLHGTGCQGPQRRWLQLRRHGVRRPAHGPDLGGPVRPRPADVRARLQPVGDLGAEGQHRQVRDHGHRRHELRRDQMLLVPDLRRGPGPLPQPEGLHHPRWRLRALSAGPTGADHQEPRRGPQQEGPRGIPAELLVRPRTARTADAPGPGGGDRRRPPGLRHQFRRLRRDPR
ncbi:hypothetical protein D3C86_1546600 [compost metagenome]